VEYDFVDHPITGRRRRRIKRKEGVSGFWLGEIGAFILFKCMVDMGDDYRR